MRTIFTFLFLLATFLNTHAQWTPLGPDDSYSPQSSSSTFSFTLINTTPYIAYMDANYNSKITVRKFNSATGWEIVGLPGFSGKSVQGIKIVAQGTTPYVIYYDQSVSRLIIQRFNGTSWETLGSNGISNSYITFDMTFIGTTPYVVHTILGGGNSTSIAVKKFNNTDWEAVGSTIIQNSGFREINISSSGTVPYIAYTYGYSLPLNMAVQKFNNNAWEVVGTEGFAKGTAMSFGMNGSTPYLAYSDGNSTNKLTVQKFEGTAWKAVGNLGFTGKVSNYTDIDFLASVPYVIYRDADNGNKISMQKFNGSAWQLLTTTSTAVPDYSTPSISFSGNDPYIGFYDYTTGINVQKFDGTKLSKIGSSGISEAVRFTAMAHAGKVPYLAYADVTNSFKLTVQKFSGTKWDVVGSTGFSAGSATYVSMATSGNTPYVAYCDGSNNSKAIVQKLNGTNWEMVGASGFSAGAAYYLDMAVTGTTPYVVYKDEPNGNKITVQKYSGTKWETVGNANFSSTSSPYCRMAILGTTPYIAYCDGNTGVNGKITVQKFNGTSWEIVGSAGFSAGAASYLDIAFSGTTPYVVYRDGGASNKATMQKFNGTNWEIVGVVGFSSSNVSYPKIAFYGTMPFVVYSDGNISGKATMQRFNGNNWELVSEGITGGSAEYINMAILDKEVTLSYASTGAFVKRFNLSTLPVNLVSFTAKANNNATVSLNWTTASEESNSFFTLYTSADGKKFKEIGKYPSTGNYSTYKVTDRSPIFGTNYYQLTQTDRDGKSTDLGWQQVNVITLATNSLEFFPNPVSNGLVTISLKALSGPQNVKIYNLLGKLVKNEKIAFTDGKAVVSVQGLPKGVYLLNVAEVSSTKLRID